MDVCLCDGTVDRQLASLLPHMLRSYRAAIPKGELVVCALGPSGVLVANKIARDISEKAGVYIEPVSLDVSEKGERIERIAWEPQGKEILLCDSIVNTGGTLMRSRRYLVSRGAKTVRTAALVVRRGGMIVPNFYCLEVERQDKVFFGSDEYPIRGTRDATLRIATVGDRNVDLDVPEPYVNSDLADFEYDRAANSSAKTYVIETPEGEACGVFHFRHEPDNSVFLDTLAMSRPFRGRGYAGEVLRFIQEYCRFARVGRCSMYAIDEMVATYSRYGFAKTGKRLELSYGTFEEMEATFL